MSDETAKSGKVETSESRMKDGLTRRSFVGAATSAVLVPRHVLGQGASPAPSDRVNIAVIGAGGRGANVATELVLGGHNIVHVCDVHHSEVDRRVARRTRNRRGEPDQGGIMLQAAYARAERSTDFRRMLDRSDGIDAVLIATPDHTHAVIAKACMEMGKHVFVEKPLTYTVHESRVLREVARHTGVVTQMGNQGQSTDGARLINEWIQAGLLGQVREVHLSTTRPVWPQGIPRPPRSLEHLSPEAYTSSAPLPPGTPGPDVNPWNGRRMQYETAKAMGSNHEKPADLDWDLFLGPAPEVPYHPIYHPFNWRGWLDWGVGAVGDIAAHTLNHPYWALGLTYPESVEATSSPFGLDEGGNPASFPTASEIVFRYAADGDRAPVVVYWRDGGLWSPRLERFPEGVDHRKAVVIVGDRGVLTHDSYGHNPRLYPDSLMDEAARVPWTMSRVPGERHAINWAESIKSGGKATSDFEYSSRLTENMLLGVVALRTGQGVPIHYDGATGTIPDNATANALLHREYRRGWVL